MKEPEVKRLVESYDIDQLSNAEVIFLEGETPPFEIEGEDDREVLSHIAAAIWVLEKMESHDLDFAKAFAEYRTK